MTQRLDCATINEPAIASMAKAKTHMPSIDGKLRAIIKSVPLRSMAAYIVEPTHQTSKASRRGPKAA